MPIPLKYRADFLEEGVYHVFNRTNNREQLFLSDHDRLSFLRKYNKYLAPFLNTFSWSLLPNHFHSMVRIKRECDIQERLFRTNESDLRPFEKRYLAELLPLDELIEHSFKRFFQSYALSFNDKYERKGNLFYKSFKRVEIVPDTHFTQCMVYIHANAQKHGIVTDFAEYPWSSWHSFMSGSSPIPLLRAQAFEWFGGKKHFIQAHKDLVKYYYETEISIE